MVQSIFRYDKLSDGIMQAEWWGIRNQGPNGAVRVLEADECRLFLGLSIQTDANNPDYGDKLYLGGPPGRGGSFLLDSIGKGDFVNLEVHDYDGQTLASGEIWVANASTRGHFLEVVGTSCVCANEGLPANGISCDMGRVYDSRSTTVSVPHGVVTRLLGGNANRVALVLSVTATVNTPFGISSLEGAPVSWYGSTPPFNANLAYRDYGPLISEPVYGTFNGGPLQVATVTITEIVRIGG